MSMYRECIVALTLNSYAQLKRHLQTDELKTTKNQVNTAKGFVFKSIKLYCYDY